MNTPEPILLKPLAVKPHYVASVLQMSRSKVYELIAQGIIPSVRIGGMIRVPHDALEKLVADAMKTRPEQ